MRLPTPNFVTVIALTAVSGALLLGVAACKPRGVHAPAADAGEASAYLAKNAKAPGVTTLPDGLQYQVVHAAPAGAPSPNLGDEIKINYEGALIDHTVFDSTYQRGAPAVMPLEGLVPGWMEALPKMHVGDSWIVTLPPKLGYGDAGAGAVIPPGAVLVFKIELLGILPAHRPGSPANA